MIKHAEQSRMEKYFTQVAKLDYYLRELWENVLELNE